MSDERDSSSIKGMLFTPASIVCAVLYYFIVIGAVMTYYELEPLINPSKAVAAKR